MPWQGGNAVRNNGTFTGNQVWQDDAAAGTKILASNHDNHDQDLADMIGETLHRGGQNAILADIDWGGYRINNLAAPVVALDAANKGYVDGLDTAARAYTDAEVAALDGQLAAVAKSGAYADLAGAPVLAAVATSGAYSDLTGAPSLSAVATSGAYADLIGAPSLATVATSGDYADLINTPTPGATTYEIGTYANAGPGQTVTGTLQGLSFLGTGASVSNPVTQVNSDEFQVTSGGTFLVTGTMTVRATATTDYAHVDLRVQEDSGTAGAAWTSVGSPAHATYGKNGTSPGTNDRLFSVHVHALVGGLNNNDRIRLAYSGAHIGGLSPDVSGAYMTIQKVG
jgi:hypothetical protein